MTKTERKKILEDKGASGCNQLQVYILVDDFPTESASARERSQNVC